MKKTYILGITLCVSAMLYAKMPSYIYFCGNGNILNSFALGTIDSITWHPYPTQSITLPQEIAIEAPSFFHPTDSLRLIPKVSPLYTTDKAIWTIEDTSIAEIKHPTKNNDIEYNRRTYPAAYLFAKKAGTTKLTLTMGKISASSTINVINHPATSKLTMDSLYNKIYSRLVVTGDKQPDGNPDFSGGDEGYMSMIRNIHVLNEMPSDHLFWIWNDFGIVDFSKNEWTSNNPILLYTYLRLYYNIDMCNEYLLRAQTESVTNIQKAEIRFLRAYFYSYLLDLFGNVPIVTEPGQLEKSHTNSTRREVYEFIISELLACSSDLSNSVPQKKNYHVNKVAAWMLLSRLYLNAEVYTGTQDYNNAAVYAQKVIDSDYMLIDHYRYLFMGDNGGDTETNDAYKEMIFSIEQQGDNVSTRSWGALYWVASYYDSAMPEHGISESWKCARSRAQLVQLFFPIMQQQNQEIPEELRGDEKVLTLAAKDDRALFCSEWESEWGHYKCSFWPTYTTWGNFNDGWGITKFTNIYSDNSYGSDVRWIDMDIPLMRKAEAYLTLAEAQYRMGNNTDAIKTINVIRKRAHATELESINLDILLAEWGREFFAEGRRRADLIRFNKFGGSDYNWECKYGESRGSTKPMPMSMNIYPIPQYIISRNPEIKQNPGY